MTSLEAPRDRKMSIFWHVLMACVLGAALAAGVRFALHHDGATYWDEAHYFNYIYRDHFGLRDLGIKRMLAGLLFDDTDRPPGYRIFALPCTTAFGTDIRALRIWSLLGLGASLAFLYGAVRHLTKSSAAAAISVIFIGLSPQVVEASAHYGTEVPLYLSIAATLYFVLREWDNSKPSNTSWIGLGIALAAGALSKVTFALVGGPILLAGIILCTTKRIRGPGVVFFVQAAILGGVLALPWWAKNGRVALRFAAYSANEYERFNSPLWNYVKDVFVFGSGVMVALVFAACLIGLAAAFLSRKLDSATKWALALLAAASACLIIPQAMSVNHSPRLMTPAFFCLAVMAAIGFANARWLRKPLISGIFAMLLIVQASLFVLPESVAAPVPGSRWTTMFLHDNDLWDYRPVFDYVHNLGLKNPSIALLGNGYSFNPAQLRLEWSRHGEEIKREQLWRYEKKDFDLNATVADAGKFDVVMTLPGFRGDVRQHQELDNQHNADFAAKLRDDPAFRPAASFTMGKVDPAELLVFVKRGK